MASGSSSAMYSLLANSMSGDETVRRPAEAALSQWESRPGFCSCLMEIIASKDLVSHVDVRLTASVYFMNSINLHWNSSQNSSGISNEEKIHLRQKLLSHLREENYEIAETLAVLISKLARFDYPTEWPELFSVLSQQLHSADLLASHRIFMILFRTLKELSTELLTAEISSQLFDISWHLLQTDVRKILWSFRTMAQTDGSNCAEQHQDELFLTCERWSLCLKIVRQLIISGFQPDAKCIQRIQPVKEVSPVLLNMVQSFLPYYSAFQNGDSKLWEFVKKACVKLMKALCAIQSRHPYSFGDDCVLPVVVDFCLNKITDPGHELLPFEGFLSQCMEMVKSVLECKEYKPSLTGPVMDEILPNERILLLSNILWRRYVLRTESDPESFRNAHLTLCAGTLFLVLYTNYRQLLKPIVQSVLEEGGMKYSPLSVSESTPKELLNNPSPKMQQKIALKSSDGESFEVDTAVALESQTITQMVKDKGVDNEVLLPQVTSKTLAKVIEYCKKHVEAGSSYKDLKAWDAEFMKIDPATLIDLIEAAIYLNIKNLVDLTAYALSDMMHMKSPEWIRRTFNLRKDPLTEEEEEFLRALRDDLLCSSSLQ